MTQKFLEHMTKKVWNTTALETGRWKTIGYRVFEKDWSELDIILLEQCNKLNN
jgi:hypothetical protein